MVFTRLIGTQRPAKYILNSCLDRVAVRPTTPAIVMTGELDLLVCARRPGAESQGLVGGRCQGTPGRQSNASPGRISPIPPARKAGARRSPSAPCRRLACRAAAARVPGFGRYRQRASRSPHSGSPAATQTVDPAAGAKSTESTPECSRWTVGPRSRCCDLDGVRAANCVSKLGRRRQTSARTSA